MSSDREKPTPPPLTETPLSVAAHAVKFQLELRQLPAFLLRFSMSPVDGIKHTPNMSWPTILSLHAGTAIISCTLLSAFNRNMFDFLIGLIVMPVVTLLTTFIITFFLVYCFILFSHKHLEFKRIYEMVVFATIPYFILHMFSGFIPPIDLIGFAGACLLLMVGAVEQFNLDRKICARLFGGLFFVFVIVWITGMIHSGSRSAIGPNAVPRSLDDLERSVH
jgi:hypothetical protein